MSIIYFTWPRRQPYAKWVIVMLVLLYNGVQYIIMTKKLYNFYPLNEQLNKFKTQANVFQ